MRVLIPRAPLLKIERNTTVSSTPPRAIRDHRPEGGEMRVAKLFVAVLAASNLTCVQSPAGSMYRNEYSAVVASVARSVRAESGDRRHAPPDASANQSQARQFVRVLRTGDEKHERPSLRIERHPGHAALRRGDGDSARVRQVLAAPHLRVEARLSHFTRDSQRLSAAS